MDGEKSIGYGIVIWLIMFAVNSGVFALGVHNFFLIQIFLAAFAGFLAYRFALKKVPASFITTSMWLGVVWAIIGIVLDAVITRRVNPDILRSWSLWIGYGLIVVAPILHRQLDYKQKKRENPRYHP